MMSLLSKEEEIIVFKFIAKRALRNHGKISTNIIWTKRHIEFFHEKLDKSMPSDISLSEIIALSERFEEYVFLNYPLIMDELRTEMLLAISCTHTRNNLWPERYDSWIAVDFRRNHPNEDHTEEGYYNFLRKLKNDKISDIVIDYRRRGLNI